MSHDLICTWLGLPPGGWPPDHYRLLGLEPGEENAALIEERVHQRLDAVRAYQMMHPEQATEAMNRLAQAFICLTEPTAKRLYDATLLGKAAPSPASNEAETAEPLSWLSEPPPVRHAAAVTAPAAPPPLPAATPPPLPDWVAAATTAVSPGAPALPSPETVEEAEPEIQGPPPPPPPPPPEPVDPLVEAAQASPMARRGLATKRALYHRIARTRQLLHTWTQLGKHLASPKRRLGRPEAQDLARLLEEVQTLLQRFPPLLGEAGQPGYLVLLLEEAEMRRTFLTLPYEKREAYSRDWRNGLKLLHAHRDFLRQELRAMRKRSLRDRVIRAVRSFFREQPAAALILLLALLALNVALWRSYAEEWWRLFHH